jgi:putative endopeptidase
VFSRTGRAETLCVARQQRAGEAIGKLYVEKYFPESSKKRMLELVHNLQTALKERIQEATWMGVSHQGQAVDKLKQFHYKDWLP